MLFFKKKHHDLMKKKNAKKYFKYAIGEIVLVVTGV